MSVGQRASHFVQRQITNLSLTINTQHRTAGTKRDAPQCTISTRISLVTNDTPGGIVSSGIIAHHTNDELRQVDVWNRENQHSLLYIKAPSSTDLAYRESGSLMFYVMCE